MSRSGALWRRIAIAVAVAGLGAGVAFAAPGVALANLPNVWGFAYVSDPSAAGTPPLAEQAGSWSPLLHAKSVPGALGQALVTFPTIGRPGGIALVTAVSNGPTWCDVQYLKQSGANEVVLVRCYEAGGTPAWVPFTVMYTQSSLPVGSQNGRTGYVHFQPSLGIVTRFNSVGATNTVVKLGTGNWRVTMPELGASPAAGGVQVTAVSGPLAAKCEVAGWASLPSSQVIDVRCFNAGSKPLSTGWDLLYQNHRAATGTVTGHFAYTINNKPLNALYAPAPAGVNFNSVLAVNSVQHAGQGLWLVRFPGVGIHPDNVLVSGFAVGAGFCNLLDLWATSASSVTVRDVACYAATGTLVNVASLITYTSG